MLDLSKLKWPIYPLPEYYQLHQDLVGSYVLNYKDNKLYVDPTSIEGPSLARRRLNLADNKLLRLKSPLYSYVDIINSPHKRFIDSSGRIIRYQKTRAAKLSYYKISSFEETTVGYVINVQGLHCKFFMNRAPQLHEKYAGILHVGRGFVLYSLEAEKLKDSYRKI